jgi:long-subunit fatty acid transport protein
MDPMPTGIEGYNINASFKGSSTYFGYQVGATYAINDLISVAIGGRLVTASNSYEGALTGVTLEAPTFGGAVTAGNYLRGVASSLPPDPAYDPARAAINEAAGQLDVATADAHLDAIQKGTGFTPIIGVNLHLSDMINIAAKYEHHTKIELTNDTEVDDVNMFPDGEKTRADLPGMFAIGAQVKPLKKLSASIGMDYFLDKPAYYGNVNDSGEQIDNESTIDENGFSIHGCLEYKCWLLLCE